MRSVTMEILIAGGLWGTVGLVSYLVASLIFRISPPTKHLIAVAALAVFLIAPVASIASVSRTGIFVREPEVSGSFVSSDAGPSLMQRRIAEVAAGSAPATAGSTFGVSAPSGNWPVTLWLAGATATLLWFLVGHIRMGRIVREARQVASLCPSHIAIRSTGRVTSACLYGFLAPSVLVPSGYIDSPMTNDSDLSPILTHELEHHRRHDLWFNLLAQIVVSLFWWCPASWILRRISMEEAERSCDLSASEQVGLDRYLLSLARFTLHTRGPLTATGIGFALRRRIQSLRSGRLSRTRSGLRFLAPVLLVAIVAASFAVPVFGADPAAIDRFRPTGDLELDRVNLIRAIVSYSESAGFHTLQLPELVRCAAVATHNLELIDQAALYTFTIGSCTPGFVAVATAASRIEASDDVLPLALEAVLRTQCDVPLTETIAQYGDGRIDRSDFLEVLDDYFAHPRFTTVEAAEEALTVSFN